MIATGLAGSLCLAGLAAAGIVQSLLGLHAVRRFAATPALPRSARPAVTILKPLHGDEPMLEAALESFFIQAYPAMQLVFGVHSPTDPAIAVVRALRHRHPDVDATLVIDSARHGANHKISNVINMLSSAKHDVLVVADSDVHAAPGYLDRIITTLNQPGTGVVTTLYAGQPAHAGLAAALGSSYISHVFLPGALMARMLGRQDCLGATMALRRSTLVAIGGFAALADHLADDAVLGKLVGRRGLAVRLANTVPTTTVPETTLATLFQHELRWARTIRSLAPTGHALSIVQFPIFWALLAVLASGAAAWALMLLVVCWAVRGLVSRCVDQVLGLPPVSGWAWWMPLRDIMSVAVIVASYRGNSVQWRGQVVNIGRPLYGLPEDAPLPLRATEAALGEG